MNKIFISLTTLTILSIPHALQAIPVDQKLISSSNVILLQSPEGKKIKATIHPDSKEDSKALKKGQKLELIEFPIYKR
jgi:hypothetical protein